MKLSELLNGIAILESNADLDTEIAEVRYDSRQVKEGDAFVAVCGFETDGHQYMEAAAANGAAVVICEKAPECPCSFVRIENTRRGLAVIGANRFGNPAAALKLIGVTGTNGKTTTTYLMKQILEDCGHKVGLIGTNQNLIGQEVLETERTTPESFELHRLFRTMADKGCDYVIMEVSSHSLVLDRVYGLRFAVGAFTNLTQDHLDFHKTMEAYAAAKAMLFTICETGVVNLDDPAAPVMLEAAACPVITYSAKQDAGDIVAKNIVLKSDGVRFAAVSKGEIARVRLGIPGEFSVYNALTALGCAHALGIPLEQSAQALSEAAGVKGRVEVVPTDTDYTVLIDYAHSPDGVENVLRAVKGYTQGRVIAVFGCGGDRDKTKRPKMGAIAARLADYCVVTSDNPRTEDPAAIVADILRGMEQAACPVEAIVDRREAIYHAMDIAGQGDTVLLMGKGHETYQEVNHVKHHMDEREIVVDYFQK